MLRRLTIRNFVIVDSLELVFGTGFGALTGETGAGKSILLDALALVLGGRGDGTVVRSGQEKADICAEFDLNGLDRLVAWLAEYDLEGDDGSVMLRRVVDAGGRSRAWINGTPVTLTQLREAGDWLADIHGQHAHHALLRADAQRMLLDMHAGAREVAAQVEVACRVWQQAVEARLRAERDTAAFARERELLDWQIQELEGLAFDAARWQEECAEHARLAHGASLIEGVDASLAELDGDEYAVSRLLMQLDHRLANLAGIDAGLSEAHELVSAAGVQVDEALHALRRYRSRLEPDPQRLSELEQRMADVVATARKYRVEPEGLPALANEWRAQLASLEVQSDPVRLLEAEGAAQAAFEQYAAQLSALRGPAATRLSEEITAAMQTLAMAGGRFEVALVPCEPSAHGLESVEFRVAANAGQTLRSLAKVVSGGELSRIGLAIQVMTSRDSAIPTLIFDEVDVGIGGRVAEIVGKLLAKLGQERQVLCVTHLPQVAACADWQWQIVKVECGGETLSRVAELDPDERLEEIARMLGGVNITETTRQHAAEMLGLT